MKNFTSGASYLRKVAAHRGLVKADSGDDELYETIVQFIKDNTDEPETGPDAILEDGRGNLLPQERKTDEGAAEGEEELSPAA